MRNHELWTPQRPRNLCDVGLRLNLGLGSSQTVAAGGGGGADIDSFFSDAAYYGNPDKSATLELGAGDIVNYMADANGSDIMWKNSNPRVLETIDDRKWLRYGTASADYATMRNLADSANVQRHSVLTATASTIFIVARFGSLSSSHGDIHDDGSGYARVKMGQTANKLTADYWDTTYRSVTQDSNASTDTTYVIAVRHNGTKLQMWINGVEQGAAGGVNCGTISGQGAALLEPKSGVNLRMGIRAGYGSALSDEAVAAKIAALMTYYGVS